MPAIYTNYLTCNTIVFNKICSLNEEFELQYNTEIVKIKRRIDTTNQERNDLIDKVDEILLQNFPTQNAANAKVICRFYN